jgi:hypothetical protein
MSADRERNGFDKISFELGQNAKGLENLNRLFEQHCEDDDRRHGENVKLLTDNNDAIKGLAAALAPIAANYKLTKRRMALVGTVGLSLLIGLSWALEAAMKWAIGWLLKVKFGG